MHSSHTDTRLPIKSILQEVQGILDYQIKKDAEMKAREDEEMRIEMAKKARQAELLAQQERAQDNKVRQKQECLLLVSCLISGLWYFSLCYV